MPADLRAGNPAVRIVVIARERIAAARRREDAAAEEEGTAHTTGSISVLVHEERMRSAHRLKLTTVREAARSIEDEADVTST